MRFKKIYIEITNNCNLSCDFCIQNKRKKEFMTTETFANILEKIKPHTHYLYFHILGEPILHPHIKEFIEQAKQENFFINITTNGYFIKRLKNIKGIRQINISLHSFDDTYPLPLKSYMENILDTIDTLTSTYISLRLWVENKHTKEMLDFINQKYKKNINITDLDKQSITLNDHVFINTFHEFIWPDLTNNHYVEKGSCYGLIDHIGILVDGTVVPCCLDSKGNIPLGNILKQTLSEMMKQERFQKMIEGFQNGIKCEELCRHCSFLEKNKESFYG